MKVSIIIPTYNRPKSLKVAIESIANQTFQDFEVVVINDGGCPVEEGVIAKSSIRDKIHYIYNQKNMGLSRSLNIGLERAQGELISYLDDDDIYYPHHLETLVNFLTNTKYKVAYTRCIKTISDPESGNIVKKEFFPTQDFNKDKLLFSNYIPIICIMHYKTCIKHIGKFDENLNVLMDWDFLVRLTRIFKIKFIDNVTCELFKRTDKSNMSSDFSQMNSVAQRLRTQYFDKYYDYKQKMEYTMFSYSQFMLAHEFLLNRFQTMKKEGLGRVAIFGASLSGQLYVEYLKKVGVEVPIVFDNDESKHGTKFCGIEVLNPDQIDTTKFDAIIVASLGYRDEIYQQIKWLEEKGIKVFRE